MNTFEEKRNYNQISFRYAKGKSLHSGSEIHPYHEILYYIDGGATFLSADFKERLTKGTLVIIPKEMYHHLQIENQNAYIRFVMNFPDDDMTRELVCAAVSQIRIIKQPNANICHILNRMCEVLHGPTAHHAETFLYGSFLSLLAEISFDIANATTPSLRKKEQLITKCLDYIEGHYTAPISVEELSRAMYVSPSTLFQCFKKELGISLHRYISEKRLVLAKKMIVGGEPPTVVYKDCGFSDYSAFYKAYRKMFAVSPSDDKGTPDNAEKKR